MMPSFIGIRQCSTTSDGARWQSENKARRCLIRQQHGKNLIIDEPLDLRAALARTSSKFSIFTEGYVSTSGPSLQRSELTDEAIRLARILHRLLPGDGEVAGLLALMLLTDARRPARTGPGGELIPMAEQDRSRWKADLIAEGVTLITGTLGRGPACLYQLQAAIAAVHDEAPSAGATDWPQIKALYEVLMQVSDNPVVALSHAVAVAMVHGPRAGLEVLGGLAADQRIASGHRLPAVRAHLLEMTGERTAAREAYLAAASRTSNLAQQRYLYARAARLAGSE